MGRRQRQVLDLRRIHRHGEVLERAGQAVHDRVHGRLTISHELIGRESCNRRLGGADRSTRPACHRAGAGSGVPSPTTSGRNPEFRDSEESPRGRSPEDLNGGQDRKGRRDVPRMRPGQGAPPRFDTPGAAWLPLAGSAREGKRERMTGFSRWPGTCPFARTSISAANRGDCLDLPQDGCRFPKVPPAANAGAGTGPFIQAP